MGEGGGEIGRRRGRKGGRLSCFPSGERSQGTARPHHTSNLTSEDTIDQTSPDAERASHARKAKRNSTGTVVAVAAKLKVGLDTYLGTQ